MAPLDSAATLDDLVTHVRSRVGAACSLVTRTTKARQYVIAHCGRPMPEWFMHSATLDYSICFHVCAMDFPLVIDEAISHPLMRGNRAVHELGIASYIGAPVHSATGEPTGAICALEFHPHRWQEDDVGFIIEAARAADRIIRERELTH